ncbi:STAS domain-containing protein [Actinokineospora terrae]|uniref:Anti-sigma factor antagonist n=1 Tax=Actinokineospora terrae TaxID=155974 RepID=A0A1H9MIT6_9PSEU|nr:STAS domain-containing protein [Actinokineospora terrae]SER23461.1 STAS domain-containing protein [Actinokineospora terrae]
MTVRGTEIATTQELAGAGRGVVLRVVGEIDLATADAFHEALTAALDDVHARGLTTLVIDLTGTRFLGSAGLAALVRAHRQTSRSSVESVVVAEANSLVMRALTVTGLHEVLTVTDSVEHALG